MSAALCPLFNAVQQFSNQGVVLAGGRLYSYLAGSSTPQATWTDSTRTVQNSNPIILDSSGRLPQEIWQDSSLIYKYVLQDSVGNQLGLSWDNIPGLSNAASAALIVNSIAALRLVSKNTNSNVFVTGYYVAGDGGGGPYYYDPTDTTSADNGGTIIVAADGGRWKLIVQGWVNVKQFGATGNGTTDDSVAIQAALNSSQSKVYVPSGNFVFSSVTMPTTIGFTLFGDGLTSKLVQIGAGIKWPTRATLVASVIQTIKDLGFDGRSGTGNAIDTTFAQQIDLLNLEFLEVPAGFSAIRIDGNPTDGTYTHDIRVINTRMYCSSTLGSAGITLGAHCADSWISDFIMNAGFVVNYCLYAETGALGTRISKSHPYNGKINVVRLNGGNEYFSWTDVIFDNALQDIFYSASNVGGTFSNCYFGAISNGYSGVVLDNSSNNVFTATTFQPQSTTPLKCAREINGSTGNKFSGGILRNSFPSGYFDLTGSGSFATGFQQVGSYGAIYNLTGAASAAQVQNTTVLYGANTSASLNIAAWPVPLDGFVLFATISVDATPAVGQTFTFNLQVNGGTIGTGVITNGLFSVKIALASASPIFSGNQITIQSVFSATSGTATPRYSVTCTG